MQNIDDNGSINLPSVFPSAFEKDPFEIKTIIEGELSKLVSQEILSESPTDVYVIERKAVNLFHPFFNTIMGIHHIASINLFKNSPVARIRAPKQRNKNKSILLTDAIGAGVEVETILNILNGAGVTIFKICGYLAKKKGIEKIKKLYPEITFKFINEIDDDETYNQILWKLIPVYHSRIEPLDLEHPFYLYSFTPKIEKDTLKDIINYTTKGLFGDDLSTSADGWLQGDNIIGYTSECTSLNSITETLISEKQKDTIKIERLLLRFRLDELKSQLRVMAFCSICIDINQFPNKEADCCDFLLQKVCNKIDGENRSPETLCPHCIDTNLSINLLNKFDDKIKEHALSNGYNVYNTRKYTPFEEI